MEDKENIIDYGSVNVPKSWSDITLKMYEDIERYYADNDKNFNVIDVLDILIAKDRDWIMNLPSEFLDIILENLSFLTTQPSIDEPSNKIKIDGVEYIINFQNKLRTGEYVAVDSVLKDDRHNYAAILGILCRKDGEMYDTKFENEILLDRIALFERQPMINIFPLLGFFLNCYMVSESLSLLYSKVEEGLNLTQQLIDNSDRIGVFKKLSLNWQTKKLRKSLKSIKHT